MVEARVHLYGHSVWNKHCRNMLSMTAFSISYTMFIFI